VRALALDASMTFAHYSLMDHLLQLSLASTATAVTNTSTTKAQQIQLLSDIFALLRVNERNIREFGTFFWQFQLAPLFSSPLLPNPDGPPADPQSISNVSPCVLLVILISLNMVCVMSI
jgi:hypothetical protein